ncbi:MAG: phosphate ABC transporter permease PstA [Pseudomonadota bacterium]
MQVAESATTEVPLRRAVTRAEPLVWLCSGAVVIALTLLVTVLGLLAVRGLGHFWPQPLILLSPAQGGETAQLGVILDRENDDDGRESLLLYRGVVSVFPSTLLWLMDDEIAGRSYPDDALAIELRNGGRAFGFADSLRDTGSWRPISSAQLVGKLTEEPDLSSGMDDRALRLRLASGDRMAIPLAEIDTAYAPNAMSFTDKLGYFVEQLGSFLAEAPRRGNVQGGVFPAIVGTVTLVVLMTLIVAPLGVLAAIYLQEYAQHGPVTRLVRIAVNNLAGVPSIVYGVFALGFFVYGLGGSLDQLFFSDRLPAPTLGAPGLLWASLTMALLTLPVVVVSTEEGLARVPRTLREGSFALGATRAETLWRVVLPAASPAVLTGLILAVARATGEVAPLLLVGVAKYSPGLPIDGEFPYLHLDRQFMHLGFYIYDLGFQSPELATAEGLVFATALLLVLIVLFLNVAAVILRGRLREAFRPDETL